MCHIHLFRHCLQCCKKKVLSYVKRIKHTFLTVVHLGPIVTDPTCDLTSFCLYHMYIQGKNIREQNRKKKLTKIARNWLLTDPFYTFYQHICVCVCGFQLIVLLTLSTRFSFFMHICILHISNIYPTTINLSFYLVKIIHFDQWSFLTPISLIQVGKLLKQNHWATIINRNLMWN